MNYLERKKLMKTLIKICGNQSFEDVKACMEMGIPYIGFVFASSKRCVEPSYVNKWIRQLQSKQSSQFVGVFANQGINQLQDVLRVVDLDVIQLHGNESPAFIKKVKQEVSKPIWKALHYHNEIMNEMREYIPFVNGFVIDSKVSSQWGGTGICFDWKDVTSYTQLAKEHKKLCFIAGGIHPENVEQLLQKDVSGIDLASGVESNQRKDRVLIKRLLERVQEYETVS